MAIATNVKTNSNTQPYLPPILIDGTPTKTINQWMNKKIANLRSIQTQGKTMKHSARSL